jgi:hypothetical protein
VYVGANENSLFFSPMIGLYSNFMIGSDIKVEKKMHNVWLRVADLTVDCVFEMWDETLPSTPPF